MVNEIQARQDPNAVIRVVKATLQGDMREGLERAMSDRMDFDSFVEVAIMAVTKTPKLAECDRPTIYKSIKEAAQLNLMLDGITGEGYLVPFWNNKPNRKCYECQFIPGYRGLMKLAYQSGKVSFIEAILVYSKDPFKYTAGLNPTIEHAPDPWSSDRGEFVGGYAVGHLVDSPNRPAYAIMSAAEITAIEQRSKAKDRGPWVTDKPEMRKKTLIRRLCKGLPLSREQMTAASREEHIEIETIKSEPLRPGEHSFASFGTSGAEQLPPPSEAPPANDAPAQAPTQPAKAPVEESRPVVEADGQSSLIPEPAAAPTPANSPQGMEAERMALVDDYYELCDMTGEKPIKGAAKKDIDWLHQAIEFMRSQKQ